MTVYISDCGGILGPPLVRWLLEHSTAAIVGTNSDHENMGPLLGAERFRFYVVTGPDDSNLLRRVSDHPDVVVVLSAVERPADEAAHIRHRAELVQSCVEIGARLIYVTPEWGDGEELPPDAPLSQVIRAEAERETRSLILSYPPEVLPYVVLQVFDVINDRLEARPLRRTPSLLQSVTAGVRDRAATDILLDDEDVVPRFFTHVEEVAECIGRAVIVEASAVDGRVIDVSHPDNRAAEADVASMVLDRVRQERPGEPLPRLAPPGVAPAIEPAAPDPVPAQTILEWRARLTLRDIVDRGVRRLVEQEGGAPEADR